MICFLKKSIIPATRDEVTKAVLLTIIKLHVLFFVPLRLGGEIFTKFEMENFWHRIANGRPFGNL
jgi:hypothetical protein